MVENKYESGLDVEGEKRETGGLEQNLAPLHQE